MKKFCEKHGISLSGQGRSTAQRGKETAAQQILFKSDMRNGSMIEKGSAPASRSMV
jgi:hypothetical protein